MGIAKEVLGMVGNGTLPRNTGWAEQAPGLLIPLVYSKAICHA